MSAPPVDGTLNPPTDGTLNEKDDPPTAPTALDAFMLEELPNENGADDDDEAPDTGTDEVGLKEKVEGGLIVFTVDTGTGTGGTSAPSLLIGWNEKGGGTVDVPELNTNEGADAMMLFDLSLSKVDSCDTPPSGALVV